MKAGFYTFLTSLFLVGLTSCSTTDKSRSTTYDDDVYSSARGNAPEQTQTPSTSPSASDYSQEQQAEAPERFEYSDSDTETTTDEKGNTYVTNNYYYDNDDYYDYRYSSRIRRFYRPTVGFGYYHSFYTNKYWYTYNPHHWGVSIYVGYNWWPSPTCIYDPFYFGGPWCGPGYGYYYSPLP